jgi:hypothetical protein
LAPVLLYLFLYAFILLLLARTCLYLCVLIQWLKLVACCPNKCSLVRRTSGHYLAFLRLVGCLKVGKLDLSSEEKMGKTILFVHELYK